MLGKISLKLMTKKKKTKVNHCQSMLTFCRRKKNLKKKHRDTVTVTKNATFTDRLEQTYYFFFRNSW